MRFLMPVNEKFINTKSECNIILTDNPIFAVTNNRDQKWQKAKKLKKLW